MIAKQTGGGRILESIERDEEENKEARILAEAQAKVQDDEEDEEETLDDIQGYSAAERRSKSRKKDADVRYISLKPFFKRNRKEATEADFESNGNSSTAFIENPSEDMDDNSSDENYVKPSPVPLPDASTCKSILHHIGFDKNKCANNGGRQKTLRYADGVLPGSGSPDHHNSQDISSPSLAPTSANRYTFF